MTNLFGKAKSSQKATKTKDNHKVRVRPEEDGFFDTLSELASKEAEMKKLKAKIDLLKQEVNEIGREEFVKLYESTGKYPGSFMLEAVESNETAQTMFTPSDRYIKVNETKSSELVEKYGEEIITEETKFAFNSNMLNKYSDEISEAIMGMDIPDADKEKIIEANTTYTVAKGTIENLSKISNESDSDIETIIEDIRPVFMVKNTGVI